MEQPQPLSGVQYNPAVLQANENSKTCIENTVPTTQVRSQPQGEIEEEVATLLLDIFRKASPALEDQQEKEGNRPLLLSPKPIKKSTSKTVLEFGADDDLSFRRRKSPGSLSPKEDILELYNNVDEEKKRKMKSEADFRAPEDRAPENEEEGPEEDEKEEAEWTQQDPDDDDYYEEDLDDDEWLEARGYAGSPSSGVMTSPNMNSSRIPRKKAPSGSACEKHKRWKKRCPDDCPMRKPKHRKGKFGEFSKFEMDAMEMMPPFEHASEIAKNLGRSPSPKVIVATSPVIAPPSPPPKDPSTVNVIAAAMTVNSSKADYVSLISWSLNQLKKESFGSLTSEDIHAIELQLLQKANVDPTECALSEFEAGMDLEFDYRARAKKLKINEERRAIFVGPSDPALRKTPKNLNSGARSKRTRDETYENDVYQEDLDPISSPEQSMDNSDMNVSPPHFRLHKAYSADDLPKSPRIQLKALNAVEIKLDLSKDKKSPKNARRTGRKYLPQACDRHKLLHAKCPANCPDRIRRDQEMAKNPDVIMTN